MLPYIFHNRLRDVYHGFIYLKQLHSRTCKIGIIHDGLWDVYNDHHMGICAEKCSSAYGISREAQDEHATESYQRAALAWEKVWKVVWGVLGAADCNRSLPNRVLVSCGVGKRIQR